MSLTKVTYSMIENAPANVMDYGAVGNGVADDTAAFQNAINAIVAQNGGTINVPSGTYKITSTLTINYPDVVIVGAGSNWGDASNDSATKLVWSGASGGTMIEIASIAGASNYKISGCGIIGLELNANSLAGKGLVITSHNNGRFENIQLTEFSSRALEMKCLVGGTELIGEASSQGNKLRCISARQLNAGSGVAFWFDGSTNSNTSYNQFESLVCLYDASAGFVFANADNNVCFQLRAFKGGIGTAYGFEFYGPTALGSVGGNGNYLYDIQANPTNGIILRGTTSGFSDGVKDNYFVLDSGNGTQIPTAEAGSKAFGENQSGVLFGQASSPFAFAEDVNQAATQRALMTTETVRIFNDSTDNMRLISSLGEWGINLDGSGNFRVLRISGTGNVNFSNDILSTGVIRANGILPTSDNSVGLGSASYRWSVVYAATGTINTSDANNKEQIVNISEIEKRVALKLKSSIKRFKFKDSVLEKGVNARYHFGTIAQDVKTAFESEGLVAEEYGVFCSDILDDGSIRLGIRYDELFAFILAAI